MVTTLWTIIEVIKNVASCAAKLIKNLTPWNHVAPPLVFRWRHEGGVHRDARFHDETTRFISAYAAPLPIFWDRRAAADTMTPAQGSSRNHRNETDFGHNVEDLLIKSNSLFQSAITNGFRISSVIVTTKSARDEDRKLIAPLVWGWTRCKPNKWMNNGWRRILRTPWAYLWRGFTGPNPPKWIFTVKNLKL